MHVDMQMEWTQNPHEAAAELANSHKQHSQRAPVQEFFIQSGRVQAPGSKMLLVSGPQGGWAEARYQKKEANTGPELSPARERVPKSATAL